MENRFWRKCQQSTELSKKGRPLCSVEVGSLTWLWREHLLSGCTVSFSPLPDKLPPSTMNRNCVLLDFFLNELGKNRFQPCFSSLHTLWIFFPFIPPCLSTDRTSTIFSMSIKLKRLQSKISMTRDKSIFKCHMNMFGYYCTKILPLKYYFY